MLYLESSVLTGKSFYPPCLLYKYEVSTHQYNCFVISYIATTSISMLPSSLVYMLQPQAFKFITLQTPSCMHMYINFTQHQYAIECQYSAEIPIPEGVQKSSPVQSSDCIQPSLIHIQICNNISLRTTNTCKVTRVLKELTVSTLGILGKMQASNIIAPYRNSIVYDLE